MPLRGVVVVADPAGGAPADVVAQEGDEVLVAVRDADLRCGFGCWFPGPGGLPGWAVAVQAGAAGPDPVAEPAAGVREVAMPDAGCGRGRVGVVAVQPVGVQRGELPDQLVVSVPQRWKHRW